MAFENGDVYLGVSPNEIYLTSFGRGEIDYTLDVDKKEQRAKSGKLWTQVLSEKWVITLPYDIIDGTTLASLETMYHNHVDLSLKIYTSPTTWFLNVDGENMLVRMDKIDKKRSFLQSGGYWRNVNIVLREV
jgi:hypothetical protein